MRTYFLLFRPPIMQSGIGRRGKENHRETPENKAFAHVVRGGRSVAASRRPRFSRPGKTQIRRVGVRVKTGVECAMAIRRTSAPLRWVRAAAVSLGEIFVASGSGSDRSRRDSGSDYSRLSLNNPGTASLRALKQQA